MKQVYLVTIIQKNKFAPMLKETEHKIIEATSLMQLDTILRKIHKYEVDKIISVLLISKEAGDYILENSKSEVEEIK